MMKIDDIEIYSKSYHGELIKKICINYNLDFKNHGGCLVFYGKCLLNGACQVNLKSAEEDCNLLFKNLREAINNLETEIIGNFAFDNNPDPWSPWSRPMASAPPSWERRPINKEEIYKAIDASVASLKPGETLEIYQWQVGKN